MIDSIIQAAMARVQVDRSFGVLVNPARSAGQAGSRAYGLTGQPAVELTLF